MSDTSAQQIGWKAVSKTGIVAAGGAEAVKAGIEILEKGGNAADAAAGTILALNVTDHGACSIGGEVPGKGGVAAEDGRRRTRRGCEEAVIERS